MDTNPNENIEPIAPNVPRRRKRTKWQNFKEAYLPIIIIAVALILIIVFIAGSVSRAKNPNLNEDLNIQTDPIPDAATLLQEEADALMEEAAVLAAGFDYSGAITVLESFSGDMTTIEGMVSKYNEYKEAFNDLVPYTDVESVPMLSFNTLMPNLRRFSYIKSI